MSESAPLVAERRHAERLAACFPVPLTRPDGQAVDGQVANISATGMLIRLVTELPIWSLATATLPSAGLRDVRVVRRNGDGYGCLFQTPLEPAELDAVLASDEALAGFDRLRAEAEAPISPPVRGGMLRSWRRRRDQPVTGSRTAPSSVRSSGE